MKYASKISPDFIGKLKETPVPWGPLGYVTYKRTYARLREDLGRTEEWGDTVERCVNALLSYGMRMEQKEVEDFAWMMYNLKALPGGRMLWQLGTSTVERIGAPSTQNCYFVKIDSPKAFCFCFDMLMLGGGVGFSVLPAHVHKLPEVNGPIQIVRKDQADVDFIVPDNREGWVELLRKVLDSYFNTGKGFSYSCQLVRGKGTRIKGFGGIASGPEDLVRGITQISNILNKRAGNHLRPIDALDIMNIIGSVVVAGNVRRSAQISLGHAEDTDYIAAKNWGSGTIPNWRAMSNNSIYTSNPRRLPESFWQGYDGSGEPYGFVNKDLMRKVGRLVDGYDLFEDNTIDGVNPCGEQGLASYEACCLAELVPFNLSKKEFITAAQYLYKVCKTCLQLPFTWKESQDIVRENQRMGIGMTGIMAPCTIDFNDWDAGYKAIRELDKIYSKEIGANLSKRITTMKPSGTLGLLAGDKYVLPAGVHPGYSDFFIRRIRFSAEDPIVEACRRNGYHVEPKLEFDGTEDWGTQIVSFPCSSAPGTVLAKDISVIQQLEKAKEIQTYWSDNNVSLTAYYRKEELPEIKKWLGENFKHSVKSASFLLHSDHGFKQAPYEPITEGQFKELSSKLIAVTNLEDQLQWDLVDSVECANGVCPIK
jgi:ribonucleoside-triphosphate reductase